MSTAQKLIIDALADVLERKNVALKTVSMHEDKASQYRAVTNILTEEEVDLRRDLEAVRHASGPQAPADERCNKPLMDGRNEIRCWAKVDHEGACI